ncbi:MAG: YbhB/YbcL family Raf kinase inhibitor-like protein [Actinobacteria bacterium]|nr:YbhB/YbcL family Raf kinase inhibitor-like protein [Actinomycetota bacterium]
MNSAFRLRVMAAIILGPTLLAQACSAAPTSTGDRENAGETAAPAGDTAAFAVSSSAFDDGGAIPVEYCLDTVDGGRNESPPLEWSGAPADTETFALTMIDMHPIADEWVHWAVIGIPANATALAAGTSGSMPSGSAELVNTFGGKGYGGPAPPPGSGDHEYVITLYALDTANIDMPEQPTADDIASAIEGHVIASASMSGMFGR